MGYRSQFATDQCSEPADTPVIGNPWLAAASGPPAGRADQRAAVDKKSVAAQAALTALSQWHVQSRSCCVPSLQPGAGQAWEAIKAPEADEGHA